MDGNRGHGMFQFFRPRHWPCLCMVLTLVIHRQLTSLAEIFDGLLQRLNKVLQANSGRTLDKRRFSGNKSLLEENDLRKTAFADTFAREFHVGGNSLLPPTRRWPCFDFCFSSSMGEFGRKIRPLCVMDYAKSYRQNPAKPLINHIYSVINPYHEKKQRCPRPRNARRFAQRNGATGKDWKTAACWPWPAWARMVD